MVKVSAQAAQHIRNALSEELERLEEIARLPEAEQPADFLGHDIGVIRGMIPEFEAAREIHTDSGSFQFAVATIYRYVERHRRELRSAEFDELFRVYAEMKAAASLSTVGGGTARNNLESIIQLGAMNHET